jgi:hypothetical protein
MVCCPTCQRPFPRIQEGKIDPNEVPCSPSHIRCVECCWPTAPEYINESGTCDICRRVKKNGKVVKLKAVGE